MPGVDGVHLEWMRARKDYSEEVVYSRPRIEETQVLLLFVIPRLPGGPAVPGVASLVPKVPLFETVLCR